uniref:Putative secreted protein n=1 Tax=Anopheles marajoara TaxID=58244 RepID=A0A2M4CG62_9DIPT
MIFVSGVGPPFEWIWSVLPTTIVAFRGSSSNGGNTCTVAGALVTIFLPFPALTLNLVSPNSVPVTI